MKLGAVYYEQKLYDRPAPRSARRCCWSPANLRARYFLATALMDAGKDDEAKVELEKILQRGSPLGRRARPARLPLRARQAATTRRWRCCRRR